MNIGIPKELKTFEGRVALTPDACHQLINNDHNLYIEKNAGILSGYSDHDYQQLGTKICNSPKDLYELCELIIKVKEPIVEDLVYLTEKHTLFCFLHLAANPVLIKQLLSTGLTAVAFESVVENNKLPLLMPMSEIAGKLAVQIGTNLLHLQNGGGGLLLGGLDKTFQTSIEKGQVLVLGAGSAGSQAALLAEKMGANVYVFDKYSDPLTSLTQLNPAINTLSNERDCHELLTSTDLLIGALLVPGKKTPHLITRTDVKRMRKGSVIVDISVDQGGCIETTIPTTYSNPTYIDEGVTHFCVTNMPGAVPRTATQALSTLLPSFIHRITLNNWFENDKIMRNAVNIKNKKLLVNI